MLKLGSILPKTFVTVKKMCQKCIDIMTQYRVFTAVRRLFFLQQSHGPIIYSIRAFKRLISSPSCSLSLTHLMAYLIVNWVTLACHDSSHDTSHRELGHPSLLWHICGWRNVFDSYSLWWRKQRTLSNDGIYGGANWSPALKWSVLWALVMRVKLMTKQALLTMFPGN